jgi:hypothetical protein
MVAGGRLLGGLVEEIGAQGGIVGEACGAFEDGAGFRAAVEAA